MEPKRTSAYESDDLFDLTDLEMEEEHLSEGLEGLNLVLEGKETTLLVDALNQNAGISFRARELRFDVGKLSLVEQRKLIASF